MGVAARGCSAERCECGYFGYPRSGLAVTGEEMARRRVQWTVRLASSESLYLQDTCRIQAKGIDDASAIAQRILKAKRLTAYDGHRWNMWGVWATRGVHSLPALVSYGDADGTVHIDPRERYHEQASQTTRSAQRPQRPARPGSWQQAAQALATQRRDRGDGRSTPGQRRGTTEPPAQA